MNAIRRICPPHIGHSSGNTSSAPGLHTLCEGDPWQRAGGRNTAAAAPGRRGRVLRCRHRHRHRLRTDCAGRPPDARIEALFGRFPPLLTPRAQAAGFRPDSNLDTLVRQALALG